MPANPPQPVSTPWGDYPSINAAAEAADMKSATLSYRIRQGLPIDAKCLRGTGVGAKAREQRSKVKLLPQTQLAKKKLDRRRMRVCVRGVVYDCAEDAAAALGVAVSTVYCAVSRGNPDRLGLGPDYANKKGKRGGKPPKSVTVAGKTFTSMAELARFIDRDPRSVRASIHAGPLARDRIIGAVLQRLGRID